MALFHSNRQKVIFLDVDGTVKVYGKTFEDGHRPIDYINALCDEFDARVVLISSRLDTDGEDSLMQKLEELGLKKKRYFTPFRIQNTEVWNARTESIQKFIKSNGLSYKNCLVFDDVQLDFGKSFGISSPMQSRLIKVDGDMGITEENYNEARQKFGANIQCDEPWLHRAESQGKTNEGRG